MSVNLGEGTRINSQFVIANSGNTYGTNYSYLGVGGFYELGDVQERNSIPIDSLNLMNLDGYSSGRRRLQMIVHTLDDGKYWQLLPELKIFYKINPTAPTQTVSATTQRVNETIWNTLTNPEKLVLLDPTATIFDSSTNRYYFGSGDPNTAWYDTPLQVYITGGTYNSATTAIQLFDTSGNTITITGITTYPGFDITLTSFTYSNNTFTIKDSTGGTFNATFNSVTGLSVNGNLNVTGNSVFNSLSANTISATTISGGTYYGDGSNLSNIRNIYTSDGSLLSNRTVIMDGNRLVFSGSEKNITVTPNGVLNIGGTNPFLTNYLLSISGGSNLLALKSQTGNTLFLTRIYNASLPSQSVYIDYSGNSQETGYQFSVLSDNIPAGTTSGLYNINFFGNTSGTLPVTNRPLLTVNNGPGDAITNTPIFKIFQTGNFLINQNNDAGFKFDVSGTGRFTDVLRLDTVNLTSTDTKVLTLSPGNVVQYRNLSDFSGGTVSGDYLPLSGGTVTGDTIFTSGLTATTISATTYLNLPIKYYTEPTAAPNNSPLTTGVGSIAIGDGAQTLSDDQLSFGTNAGSGATGSSFSNFIGWYAGKSASDALHSNFIGTCAGSGATFAECSNFIGCGAGFGSDSCCSNFIGVDAGVSSISSNISNFIGCFAGYFSTGSSISNFIGDTAGGFACNSSNANFIGNSAGCCASSSSFSNFIGIRAGAEACFVNFSNFIGERAGSGSCNSSYSNFIGACAGASAKSACTSNFIGRSAGATACNSNNTNFIGTCAGLNALSASSSTFIGEIAGFCSRNTIISNFIGTNAGGCSTNIDRTNYIGYQAGLCTNDINRSNFIGVASGQWSNGANRSNFIGYWAGRCASGATFSNFIGDFAGCGGCNSSYSNFIGANSGIRSRNTNFSNFIGYNTGFAQTGGTNNILIGTNVSLPNDVSNSINIGGVLFGINTYSITAGTPSVIPTTQGKIGIGVVTPLNRLHIEDTSDPLRLVGLQSGTTDTRILSTDSTGVIRYTNLSGITAATSADTYTTGFTYSANTFTITDNSGNTFNTTINDVTGLTVNGNLNVTGDTTLNNLTANTLSATTISGGTLYGDGSNLTNIDNIYTVDGSLQSDRVVNLSGRSLNITGTSNNFRMTPTGQIRIGWEGIADPDNSNGSYAVAISNFNTPGPPGNIASRPLILQAGSGNTTWSWSTRANDVLPNSTASFDYLSNSASTNSSGYRQFLRAKSIPTGTTSGVWNICFIDDNTGGAITQRPLFTISNGNDFGFFTTPLFKIYQNGNVGINQYSDSGFKFDVGGSGRFTSNLQLDTVSLSSTDTKILTLSPSNVVQYTNLSTITGATSADTYTTGFTYSANTFTITDNSGNTFNATINVVTGFTVDGYLNVTQTAQTGNAAIFINDDPLYQAAVAIQNLSNSPTSLTALQFNDRNGLVRANFGYYPDNYWNVQLRDALYFANVYDKIVFTSNSGSVGGVGKDIIFQTIGLPGVNQMMIHGVTGNLSINSNTDSGFKFDVNGTSRFSNTVQLDTVSLSSTDTKILTLSPSNVVQYTNLSTITGATSADTYTTGGTYISSASTLNLFDNSGNTVTITGFTKYFITGSTPTGIINYGDKWYDINTGIELVWINDGNSDQWVQPANTPGPPGYSNLIITTGVTTSALTLDINTNYYGVNYAGNVDLTLPNPSGNDGYNIHIKDESGNASIYRIRVNSVFGLIDGNTYVDMNTNYMSLHFVARNNNWWII